MLSYLLGSYQMLQHREPKDEKEEPKPCNIDEAKYCNQSVTKKTSLSVRQDHGIVGKRERHNKVYTSKGIRDRRVRLSAHTAIQFYDIQDRLGYDQPSKAIDWLIEKAKPAIQVLSQDQDLIIANDNYYAESLLYHQQCSSVNNNEAIFSMNQTQSYEEDPYGFDIVQNSSPICFTNNLNSLSSQPELIHTENTNNQLFSQWGTLQSSNLLSLIAANNPPICAHGHTHANSHPPNSNLLSTSTNGGFVGV